MTLKSLTKKGSNLIRFAVTFFCLQNMIYDRLIIFLHDTRNQKKLDYMRSYLTIHSESIRCQSGSTEAFEKIFPGCFTEQKSIRVGDEFFTTLGNSPLDISPFETHYSNCHLNFPLSYHENSNRE